MAGVLYIRDPVTGEFAPVPVLVGPPGPGVPAGGAAGQVLVKSGEGDYAAEWRNPYPVGSIYMSVNSTSPASLFGGTWEAINGRFLVGTGAPELNDDGTSPGSYSYAAGAKGGEANHTLTVDEMPSHRHFMQLKGYLNPNAGEGNWQYSLSGVGTIDVATNLTGGGNPHSNVPPYLAVYMWKRVS